MRGSLAMKMVLLSLLLSLLVHCSASYPLCTDLRAPFNADNAGLAFCRYNGSICCNSSQDLQLQKQFKAMNVSDPGCASLLKSVLCARCDPFSGELYQVEQAPRAVPVLCNSSVSANSTRSQLYILDFCSNLWDKCHNTSILNSPFAFESKAKTTAGFGSRISDSWSSAAEFCNEFGGASDNTSVCFSGGPVKLAGAENSSTPSGVCLEKLGNGSYLNMVAHSDGSNRVFLSNQPGKIWLATIPKQGSGEILGINESSPFLDLTDEVHFESELGMMGLALHPNYQNNGRFFVSFNCDKVKWPECSGRCSCNSDVGCDPSKIGPDNGANPCQYHSVISEFTTNQSSPSGTVIPKEVRRIFTMGLPFSAHHGGQILFGPKDGYLYFMMGDGGSIGDPYNFSQNRKSLLGKIMRLDVDNLPNSTMISKSGLWGNYSVPEDNPFSVDKELASEIWALGFRNPWRCSFDLERPSYFLCADVGQDLYEEVNIVTKGGNYGWRVYEGPILYHPPQNPGGNTSASSIKPIFPVMGYNHSQLQNPQGSASITGGYFYRSMVDPCLYGRYMYADLYGSGGIWVGTENPENSGNFTSAQVPYGCAKDSPIQCGAEDESLPALGAIFSFGQDNSKDTFVLTSSGLYRIVSPSRCNFACSKETVTPRSPPASNPPPPPPSTSMAMPWRHRGPGFSLLSPVISYIFLFGMCCNL
ncbi:HIPL1 protein isoform X2 [Rhodamnia argentea]|uniref:HIPL1 protein isoform X2 n=1 Tax=Rhodamnia argentea TaxID=178133 RepID=A0A8B8P7P2_9MYRT|nr:HIPL1 protein isoform X2 [Rhodamnia argentea]